MRDEFEDIQLYLARYIDCLENGFKVLSITHLEGFDEEHEHELYVCKPKMTSTINKEKASIEAFFKYMNKPDIQRLALEKNFLSYKKKVQFSKGSGYGLKMSPYLQRFLIDDESIVKSKNSSARGDTRAFPYQLFGPLLDISEPRERLAFLLAGACSARVNQVLNLTFYDIDYQSRNVWLIDPISNDQLGFDGRGRKEFLKNEYGIDAKKDKSHNKFGFKYPIPTAYKARDPLFWLNQKYKHLFFKTLLDYHPVAEHARKPRHPFFFVRGTGKRYTAKELNEKLEKYIQVLMNKYPEYKHKLDGCTMHTLRHMFGSVMASVEAKLVIDGRNASADRIRRFTSYAMGHSKPKSTEVYFNRPWDLEIEFGEYIQSVIEDKIEK